MSSLATVSSTSSLRRDHCASQNGTLSCESVVAVNSSYQGCISDQLNCSKDSLEGGSGRAIGSTFLQIKEQWEERGACDQDTSGFGRRPTVPSHCRAGRQWWRAPDGW